MLYPMLKEYYERKQELLTKIRQQDDLNANEDNKFKLWKELARSLVKSSDSSKSMKDYYTISKINLEFADALEELILSLKKLEYDVQYIQWKDIKRALVNFTRFANSNKLKIASCETVNDDSNLVKVHLLYIDNPYVFTIIPEFESKSAITILNFKLEPLTVIPKNNLTIIDVENYNKLKEVIQRNLKEKYKLYSDSLTTTPTLLHSRRMDIDNFNLQKLLYELHTANFNPLDNCIESKSASNIELITSAESTSSYKLLTNSKECDCLKSSPYIKKIELHLKQITHIFDQSQSMFNEIMSLSTSKDMVACSNHILEEVNLANSLYYTLFNTKTKPVCRVTEIKENGVELYIEYPNINVSVVYNYQLTRPNAKESNNRRESANKSDNNKESANKSANLYNKESANTDKVVEPITKEGDKDKTNLIYPLEHTTDWVLYEEGKNPFILNGSKITKHNFNNIDSFSYYQNGHQHYFTLVDNDPVIKEIKVGDKNYCIVQIKSEHKKAESCTPYFEFNSETEYLLYEEGKTPIILKGCNILVYNQCNPTQYSIYLDGKRQYFVIPDSSIKHTKIGSKVYPTVKLVKAE